MRQAGVLKRVTSSLTMILAAAYIGGCEVPSFIDPAEPNPITTKTLQKPILTSISSIDPQVDDPEVTFYNASDVKLPMDNKAIAADYRIGVGDLITVSVNDLVGLGVETTKQMRVSESGNISMPLLGQIKAVGLTEDELQKSLANAYRDGQIITNAQVSVTVADPRARTFSAIGAVNNPGQFSIPQSEFRLLDALVMMRDASATIDTIYIIRQINEDPGADTNPNGRPTAAPYTPPAMPVTPANPAPGVDPLAPPRGTQLSQLHLDVLSPHSAHPVMLQAGDPLAGRATAAPVAGTPFQFGTPTGPAETRTIRVPIDALRSGDLRYNIVIRPKDIIIAPNPPAGEYYMSGHAARAGVYTVPARGITLKQAVISAGMLDGVAIPQRTELIRRVGMNREAFVRIDLAAIFSGNQPDIYLKPNDIVHVGTNIIAPFLAAIRGGFRITYGFGFLYDRNFYKGTNGLGLN